MTTIGPQSFSDTKLTSLHIPKNVTSIEWDAFSNTQDLLTITVDPENTSFSVIDSLLYKMSEGTPCTVLGYPYAAELTEISIAEGTTSIPMGTFTNAYTLEYVTLPETLETIGYEAFYRCRSLKEIAFPDSLVSIGGYSFFYCEDLKSLSLGANFTTIGGGSFNGCTSLETVTCSEENTTFEVVDNVLCSEDCATLYLYPAGRTDKVFRMNDSITTVAKESIRRAGNLKELYLSKNIQTIETSAIGYCTNLDSIYFYGNAPTITSSSITNNSENLIIYRPADATDYTTTYWTSYVITDWDPMNVLVLEGTFGDVSWKFEGSMGRVTLIGAGSMPDFTSEEPAPWSEYMPYIQTIEADGLTGMGDYAFYQAGKLLRMQNEGTLTEIGDYAFTDCDKLFAIDTANASSIGIRAFKNCSSLTEVGLGSKMTTLSEEVFSGCTNISNLMLPESLTTIETSALKDCTSIRTINIPEAVTTISSNAVAGGAALEKVYFYGAKPADWAADSFTGCNSNLTFYYRSSQAEWEELGGMWNEIPVQGQENFYSENQDYYSFNNSAASFGYEEEYRIPRQRYIDVLDSLHLATYYYALNKFWGGSCYGMAGTTLEFYENPNFSIADYDATAQSLYDVLAPEDEKASLTELIEGYQISQYHEAHMEELFDNYNNYKDLVWRIEEFERSGGLSVDSQATPVVIAVYSFWGGHAIVPLSVTV